MDKPNYTQVPNIFIDEYLPIMSASAAVVFLVIVRQTMGWHKDTDAISLSQMEKKTGLSRHTAIKAVNELESMGVIIKEKNKSGISAYTLNLIDSAEIAPEKPWVVQKLHGGSAEIAPVGSAEIAHTKETVKDTIQKKKNEDAYGASCHSEIKKIFADGSKLLTGQEYYHNGKEAKHIKQLEKRYETDLKTFLSLTVKFMRLIQSNDKFWSQQPFTPSAFNSLYDRIKSAGGAKAQSFDDMLREVEAL